MCVSVMHTHACLLAHRLGTNIGKPNRRAVVFSDWVLTIPWVGCHEGPVPAEDSREQQKRLEQRREQRRQVLLQVVRVPDAARQRVKVDRFVAALVRFPHDPFQNVPDVPAALGFGWRSHAVRRRSLPLLRELGGVLMVAGALGVRSVVDARVAVELGVLGIDHAAFETFREKVVLLRLVDAHVDGGGHPMVLTVPSRRCCQIPGWLAFRPAD